MGRRDDTQVDTPPPQEICIITDETQIEPEDIPNEVKEDEIFQLQSEYPVIDHWLEYNEVTKKLTEVFIVFNDGDTIVPPKSPGASRNIDRFEIETI